MPGCAAVGCSNSSEKGFLMKRFPKDPKRRKEWAVKTRRANWTPTNYSCLCEVHFAPEMWETTREDGTRKLKANAVPTKCTFSKEPIRRRSPRRRSPPSDTSTVETITAVPLVENITELMNLDLEQPSTSQVQEIAASSSSQSSESSGLGQFPEASRKDLEMKLVHYEKMYGKQKQKARNYQRLYRNMNKQLRTLRRAQYSPEQNSLLKQICTDDQIQMLTRRAQGKSIKFLKWSNKTIMKALKLKFSCGGNGYQELLKQGQPLPSVRTLQRRLQGLQFDSGILYKVFQFLKIKVSGFQNFEKDCVLVLDETAITAGSTYDTALQKYFGDVTLPHHEGVATHVLAFMLAGVTLRWKQVVAYYFTGDSVNGAVLKDIIVEILSQTDSLGLNVISVTSDMGSSNQGLWRTVGIIAGRHQEIKCKTSQLDERKEIYFMADVPHLFKNIKSMLLTNKIIAIPKDIQIMHSLPTNVVVSQHILDLIEHQKNHSFQLAPKLSEDDLLPSHFSKMKVSTSTNVINHSVCSALNFLAEQMDRPELKTTAWFLEQVERCFF